MPTAEADQLLTVGELRVRCARYGPETAPVVVFSHALGGDGSLWAPQVAALGTRFRLLCPDTRGHGGTDAPPGPYSIAGLAGDVIRLLDAQGVERAHFCGISMGGAIGLWLARHAPDRLHSVVLANTAVRIGNAAGWDQRIQQVREQGMAAVAEPVVSRWLTPEFRACAPQVHDFLRAVFERTPVEGYAGCCAALRDAELRAGLDTITVPTLVITGAHDQSVPAAEGEALARRIPGARRVQLEAAHLSNIEADDAFNAALLRFWKA